MTAVETARTGTHGRLAVLALHVDGYELTGLKLAVGDVSLRRGGKMPGHRWSHRNGLDVDIRPIRDDGRECGATGVNWHIRLYDRSDTGVLVRSIRKAATGHVQFIAFNDPAFLRRRVTVFARGHDDHLHVRFCEAAFRDRAYAC